MDIQDIPMCPASREESREEELEDETQLRVRLARQVALKSKLDI